MPSRPAALQISLLEPVILLRSSKDSLDGQYDIPEERDESGSYQHLDENLNQLRGLVSLNHDRLPPGSNEVQISFRGVSVWVEWTNKVPRNCLREIVSYTVTLPIDAGHSGTTSVPFSIPVPSNLPPTVDADSGSNRYAVTATIAGCKAMKDFTAETAVRLDLAQGESQSRRNERVEGLCFDDMVQYAWTADEEVCIGAILSMNLSLLPLAPMNLSVGFMHILLEEKTMCNDSAKTPVVKRWSLVKLQPACPNMLLPWTGETGCSQVDAALLSAGLGYREHEQKLNKPKSTSAAEADSQVRKDLASSTGPWNLSWNVRSPSCSQTAINNTIKHPKSAISVTHRLVLQMLFQGPDEPGAAIELTRPIHILSNFLAEPGSALPCYWCDSIQDHPYNFTQTWRQLAAQECSSNSSTKVLPAWLSRLTGKESASKGDTQSIDRSHSSQIWLDLSSQSNPISATIT